MWQTPDIAPLAFALSFSKAEKKTPTFMINENKHIENIK